MQKNIIIFSDGTGQEGGERNKGVKLNLPLIYIFDPIYSHNLILRKGFHLSF